MDVTYLPALAAQPDPVPAAAPDPCSPAGVPDVVRALLSDAISAAPTPEPAGPAGAGSKIPPRWAAALVGLTLVLTGILVGLGHPVSMVLEALGLGGFLGIELVRRLNREL